MKRSIEPQTSSKKSIAITNPGKKRSITTYESNRKRAASGEENLLFLSPAEAQEKLKECGTYQAALEKYPNLDIILLRLKYLNPSEEAFQNFLETDERILQRHTGKIYNITFNHIQIKVLIKIMLKYMLQNEDFVPSLGAIATAFEVKNETINRLVNRYIYVDDSINSVKHLDFKLLIDLINGHLVNHNLTNTPLNIDELAKQISQNLQKIELIKIDELIKKAINSNDFGSYCFELAGSHKVVLSLANHSIYHPVQQQFVNLTFGLLKELITQLKADFPYETEEEQALFIVEVKKYLGPVEFIPTKPQGRMVSGKPQVLETNDTVQLQSQEEIVAQVLLELQQTPELKAAQLQETQTNDTVEPFTAEENEGLDAINNDDTYPEILRSIGFFKQPVQNKVEFRPIDPTFLLNFSMYSFVEQTDPFTSEENEALDSFGNDDEFFEHVLNEISL